MLIDIASGREITKIPHRESLDLLRARLNDDEFVTIVERINELIEDAGGEIATAGWLPGSDWRGTPFWPIYEKGANKNQSLAAKRFGLVVGNDHEALGVLGLGSLREARARHRKPHVLSNPGHRVMPRQDSTCSSRAPSGAPPSGSDVKPEDLHLDRVKALLQDRSREYGLANLLQRVVGLVEEAISDGELSCALQADLTAWLREAREFDGP